MTPTHWKIGWYRNNPGTLGVVSVSLILIGLVRVILNLAGPIKYLAVAIDMRMDYTGIINYATRPQTQTHLPSQVICS